MRIIQVLPTLAYGDAIGNETIALKDFFGKQGMIPKYTILME